MKQIRSSFSSAVIVGTTTKEISILKYKEHNRMCAMLVSTIHIPSFMIQLPSRENRMTKILFVNEEKEVSPTRTSALSLPWTLTQPKLSGEPIGPYWKPGDALSFYLPFKQTMTGIPQQEIRMTVVSGRDCLVFILCIYQPSLAVFGVFVD
jgi:hypothetical protein